MACPQDEQLMAPPLWTTSSKRPQPYAWALTDAVSPENSHLGRARWRATGARGGGPAARGRRREVIGGGGPHEARRGLRCHGGGLMRRGRRIGGGARKKRKGGGVRRGRRGGDRSTPGTGGYIPGRFTPGASHQPGVKVLYSRCVLPTESKGPGW